MNREKLVQEIIQKFTNRLESAEILFKAGKYEDSISRAYYALFDILRGLLEMAGVTAKSHQGAILKFHQIFIKTGKVDRRFVKTIARLQKLREEADYSFKFELSKEDAQNLIEEVKEFFKEVERLLK